MAPADVNGDGKPDLVVANYCLDPDCSLGGGLIGVLLNDGGGSGSGSGNGGGGTPAGTYNLTVTGAFSSGSTAPTHSAKLTLVVQ